MNVADAPRNETRETAKSRNFLDLKQVVQAHVIDAHAELLLLELDQGRVSCF